MYGFSLLGLVLVIIGTVRILDLGLKTFIFTKADNYATYPYPAVDMKGKEVSSSAMVSREEQDKYNAENRASQRQNTASSSLAMIIVGFPLFLYHWKMIHKTE